MPSVSDCPSCGISVLVLSSAYPNRRLRCPGCRAVFRLDEARSSSADTGPLAWPISDQLDDPPLDEAERAGMAVMATMGMGTTMGTGVESGETPFFTHDVAPTFDDALREFDATEAEEASFTLETDELVEWRYPGFAPPAVESFTFLTASTSIDHSTWVYPGLSGPAGEPAASEPSPVGKRYVMQRFVTTRIETVWTYPGSEPWTRTVEVIEEVAVEVVDEVDSWEAPQPIDSPVAESTAVATAEAAWESTAASSRPAPRRKKKQADLSVPLMMAGVVGGGVLGLAIGYLILVWIGGPQADFAHLIYK